jgi:hypothetical protein
MNHETFLLLATVALILSPRIVRFVAAVRREDTKRRYAAMVAPIFEFSSDELDRDVQARAASHRAWLAVVDHPFLRADDVHALVYCEGEFWGETWENYLARCARFKTEKMRAHQKRIKGLSPEHYHRAVLGQTGYFDAKVAAFSPFMLAAFSIEISGWAAAVLVPLALALLFWAAGGFARKTGLRRAAPKNGKASANRAIKKATKLEPNKKPSSLSDIQ